jgi:putative selenate reductase FAD-binding subunit
MGMDILRPASIGEALRAGRAPGAAYLGGGTWLASAPIDGPRTLVSLENLGLDHVRCGGGSCLIGATVTFQQLIDVPNVPSGVREAAAQTASRTIRGMATVGGELGLLPPSSALVPVLIALDARVLLAGSRQQVEVATYCRSRPAGLVLGVSIPAPSLPCAVRCVSRTSHSRKSLVVAVSARALAPVVRGLRLVASDCRGQVLRLAGIERALEGAALPPRERIEVMVRGAFAPAADMHASSPYKACLAGVFAADMLHGLAGREARR